MRWISETKAFERLSEIRDRFRLRIAGYETNAKSCAACTSPGACCLDEHFVNVRISRLEAAAILRSLHEIEPALRDDVIRRTLHAIEVYRLDASEAGSSDMFACPLFEPGRGCLVHLTAKPLPCVAHACYERREDLPPEHLLSAAEAEVDSLNRNVYRENAPLKPLPLAVAERLRMRR